jgi:hypothetical protein
MSNSYQNSAQERKAAKLAAYLHSVGITAAQMSHATAQEWAMAAHLAQVTPSRELGATQAKTIRNLEQMERLATQNAAVRDALNSKGATA